MNNILIYPKFKKLDLPEIVDDNDLLNLSNHYTEQIIKSLQNHGLDCDPIFFRDMAFLREVLIAIISRTQSKHHSIQDWIDDAYIPEMTSLDTDLIYDDEE